MLRICIINSMRVTIRVSWKASLSFLDYRSGALASLLLSPEQRSATRDLSWRRSSVQGRWEPQGSYLEVHG